MDSGEPLTTSEGQGRNIVQLLALFLLLLSFFILLNSLSSFEHKKARAVLGKVNETFAGQGIYARDEPFVEMGDRAAVERFWGRVRAALARVFPTVRLEGSPDGQHMRLTLPSDSIFLRGSANIRSDRIGLVRSLAAALKDHPAELRFRLALTLGVSADERELANARAGAFARAIVAAGAPGDVISIGVRMAKEGTTGFDFEIDEAKARGVVFAPVGGVLPAHQNAPMP